MRDIRIIIADDDPGMRLVMHKIVDRAEGYVLLGEASDGKGFRNTEILSIRDGKIVEVEVYFGWSLPHSAPDGGFVESGEVS